MAAVWAQIQRVPAAVWAAIGAALAVGLLILRGRHLEAELARSKVREQASKAAALGARHKGRREVHELAADEARAEAAELEAEITRIETEGSEQKARIDDMNEAEAHREYLELARAARMRARQR